MKHKWKSTPRGRKTKYYTCQRCGLRLISTSIKEADKTEVGCVKQHKEKVMMHKAKQNKADEPQRQEIMDWWYRTYILFRRCM